MRKKKYKKRLNLFPFMRKRRSNNSSNNANSEVMKGVIIIVLLALVVLSFLSLFHLSGRFGFLLEKIIKMLFGGGYFVFPFLLTAITYLFVVNRKAVLKISHYIGILFFTFSFYGLLHLTQPLEKSIDSASNGLGGGYAGVVFSYPLVYALDFWGGLVVLIAIFIGSFILIFNISLDSLLSGLKILKPAFLRFLEVVSSIKGVFSFFKPKNSDSDELGREEYVESSDADNNSPLFTENEITSTEDDLKGDQQEIEFKRKRKTRKRVDLPIDLLSSGGGKPTSGDINSNIKIIKKTLENFGISIEMGDYSVGPTVTQYTFKPADGVKLSQIIALSNDLSLALAAHPIRIEAPIPGKSLVGIEVPNKSTAKVRLRDVITSKEFKKRPSDLMISLGKDVSGATWLADLTKNPHMLIAGSTNSGKTICINSLIISLFYQNSPDDLKFIMIDPKRVELPVYNNTPYLITPVITNVKKTVNALKWAVSEMDRRFEVLSKAGNRDILSYRASGNSMHSIVIIIDELADLMASAGPEIEALIIRLAQMSRAVGIYLILATQRPSVNVITGTIKANIISRIAFSVASLIDSRTILDSSGAEKLLGRGDMLFVSADISKPKRLQGAFVSEAEIKRITNYLKEKYDEVEYDDDVVEKQKGSINGFSNSSDEDDELIEDAKEIIIKSKKASASYLQRRMRIGYNKASRLIEALEEMGVVGPPNGAKPREVLVGDTDVNVENREVGVGDDEKDEIQSMT